MALQKRVAILVETSRSYGRGLLNGICRYQQHHGKWLTYFRPGGVWDAPQSWLKRWKGDGILARIETLEMAECLAKFDVPIIDLRGTETGLRFPYYGTDNGAIARLAANYLRELGTPHFAFVGEAKFSNPCFEQRHRYFKKFILDAKLSYGEFAFDQTLDRFTALENEKKRLAEWIRKRPKPLAVFAMNDDIGLAVLEACRKADVTVPDTVAVLGVDDDSYLCNLSIPPLSSIDVQSEKTGFEAAALLDRMMAGKKIDPISPTKPRGIVIRHSTDILFANDPLVAKALRAVREFAADEKCSSRVLESLGVSRIVLSPRLKNAIGRTLNEQIQHERIQQAIKRMKETNEPLKYIAIQCGFQNIQYFTRVFREITGETPASYREARYPMS